MSSLSNHPFINNKYTNTYFKIISGASGRLKSTSVVYERHHIIPESFFISRKRKGPPGTVTGDPNDPSNLVWLTPKEHFIAHKLLVKMTNGGYRAKMVYALWLMTHTSRGNEGSLHGRTYEVLRTEYATLVSEQFRGRKRSQDEINKQIITRKEKGYKLSPNQIASMQAGRLGKSWFTNGSDNRYMFSCPEGFVAGYTLSPEQIASRDQLKQQGHYKRNTAKRKKQSATMSGRKWYTNGIKSVLAHECPYGFTPGRSKQDKQWYTDGVQNLLVENNPGGNWRKGFTSPKEVIDRQRLGGAKGGSKSLGMKWWNDGVTNYRSAECPSGCVTGRLKFIHKKKRRANQ